MDCPSVDTFVGEYAAKGLLEELRQALSSYPNLINERESWVRKFVYLNRSLNYVYVYVESEEYLITFYHNC